MSIVFDNAFQVIDGDVPQEKIVKIKCSIVKEDIAEISVGSDHDHPNNIGIRSITDGDDDEGSFVFMSPSTFDDVVAAVNKIRKEMR